MCDTTGANSPRNQRNASQKSPLSSDATPSRIERRSMIVQRPLKAAARLVIGRLPHHLPASSSSLDYAVSLDGPPCMSELPAETRPARLKMEASPRPAWGSKARDRAWCGLHHRSPTHPDSRSGPSPHLQGRVMDEQRTVFVGIDVSKDRLDVHLKDRQARHSCVPREGKGMDDLVIRASRDCLSPLLYWRRLAASKPRLRRPWPALGCRSGVVNPRQIRDFASARWAAWPRPTRSTRR